MAGRPATVVDNRVLMDYLSQFDRTNPIPDWMDSVIYGAARAGEYNPSSPYVIFSALKQLEELSYETAERFVNRKLEAFGDRTMKRRYCFMFFARLRCAHSGIQHHYERIHKQPLISAYKIGDNP